MTALLRQHADALAEAMYGDFGHRSPLQSLATDVLGTMPSIRHARTRLGRWTAPQRVSAGLVRWLGGKVWIQDHQRPSLPASTRLPARCAAEWSALCVTRNGAGTRGGARRQPGRSAQRHAAEPAAGHRHGSANHAVESVGCSAPAGPWQHPRGRSGSPALHASVMRCLGPCRTYRHRGRSAVGPRRWDRGARRACPLVRRPALTLRTRSSQSLRGRCTAQLSQLA